MLDRYAHTAFAALILLALALPSAALAQPNPVQPEIVGLWYLPSGDLETGGTIKASDKFGGGPGFGAAVSIRTIAQLHLVTRLEWMKGTNDADFSGFVDIVPDFIIGSPDGERQILTVTPLLLLLQYRWQINSTYTAFGEGGGGVADFRQKLTLLNGSTPIFTGSGRQQSTVFSLGAGVSMVFRNYYEFVARVSYLQPLGRNGEVFGEDDKPAFLTGSLGIRLR